MAVTIPEEFLDLAEKRSIISLATLMADGRPQVTPMWWLYEAPYIVVNTARGRVKEENMRRDPRVALEIRDPNNPYRYLGAQGRVVEMTEQGAVEVIDRLAERYTGRKQYGVPAGEVRVTVKIELENVWTMG